MSPELALETVSDLAGLAVYSDDSIVSRTLMKSQAGSLTLFAFDAGQHLSEHSCPYDATAHVIDGKGEIVINGASHEVAAGQVVLMPANIPHAVNAKQRFKMILTMFKNEKIAD
ncbi:MAG TPA: cupin domain-containing protein [Phycisphaerae bacterium]|nr:cupin domain-containing protein [Phycisphaerae bacterium]